jgi:hypothetical protein
MASWNAHRSFFTTDDIIPETEPARPLTFQLLEALS